MRARLVKGFSAQAFSQLVSIVIQLTSVPLFLSLWGKDLYGEWLLLTAIPTYFSMSDFGFGDAAGTEMTLLTARGDRAGALRVFQSAWLIISAASFSVCALALLTVQFLPITTWLHLSLISSGQARWVFCLMTLQIVLSQQGGLFAAVYRCEGNFAVGTLYANAERFGSFLLMAGAVVLGGNPVAVAAAGLSGWVIGNTFTFLDTRRRSGWLRYGWSEARWETIKKLSVPAVAYLGLPIGSALSLQGITLVIGTLFGPATTVLFITSRTLSRLAWQAINAVTNTIAVELSNAFGQSDIDRARKLHRQNFRVAIIMGVSLSGFMFFAGKTIFFYWTHNKITFNPSLFSLMAFDAILVALWTVSGNVTRSLNKHGMQVFYFACLSAFSIAMSFYTSRYYGINGILYASIVSNILMLCFVLYQALKYTNDTIGSFAKGVLQIK